MTFWDDFVRLKFDGGDRDMTCKQLNIEWPPPECITVFEMPMRRKSISPITDAQRRKTSSLVRGAIYIVDHEAAENET